MTLVVFLLHLLMEKPPSHFCVCRVNRGPRLVTSDSLDPGAAMDTGSAAPFGRIEARDSLTSVTVA